MKVANVVANARSRRRFVQDACVSDDVLLDMIECARLSPSAGNLQRLKFMPVSDRLRCDKLFPSLRWAGYFKDWSGPADGQRPAAYIVIFHDANLGAENYVDLGIAAQSINLCAVGDHGLACCMIGAFDPDEVRNSLLPGRTDLTPLLVIAVGVPDESVVVEPMTDGNVHYWRDSNGVHHVPKRTDVVLFG